MDIYYINYIISCKINNPYHFHLFIYLIILYSMLYIIIEIYYIYTLIKTLM